MIIYFSKNHYKYNKLTYFWLDIIGKKNLKIFNNNIIYIIKIKIKKYLIFLKIFKIIWSIII